MFLKIKIIPNAIKTNYSNNLVSSFCTRSCDLQVSHRKSVSNEKSELVPKAPPPPSDNQTNQHVREAAISPPTSAEEVSI